MKKVIITALILSLLLVLSSCGTQQGTTQGSTPAQSQADQQDPDQGQETEPVTEEPKELPKTLTKENANEFIEIIQAESTLKHDLDLHIDWLYQDGVLVIFNEGNLWYNNNIVPWKEYMDDITKVIIADGCTDINNKDVDFSAMKNIESVVLPESLKTLPIMHNCNKLTYMNIPSGIKRIEDEQFYRTNIERVTLPEGLEFIGKRAFSECTNLKEVNIPSSVTRIDEEAFNMCENLAIELKLPEGLTELGNCAFAGCKNITGDIVIPSTFTQIGRVFNGCENLDSVTFPDGLEWIGDDAFLGCKKFTEIKIPTTVTRIDGGAFGECLGLTSIYIPANVKEMHGNPFYGCDNLTQITSDSEWCYMDGDVLIWKEPGSAFDKKNGEWCYSSYVIKALPSFSGEYSTLYGCRGIDAGAFANCKSLKSLIVNSHLVDISYEAFKGCTGLEYVKFKGGDYDHIGERAFFGCTGLKSIDVLCYIYLVKESAFEGCTSLESVNGGSDGGGKITCVDHRGFAGCTALTKYDFKIEYDDNVFEDSFEGCINLEKANK